MGRLAAHRTPPSSVKHIESRKKGMSSAVADRLIALASSMVPVNQRVSLSSRSGSSAVSSSSSVRPGSCSSTAGVGHSATRATKGARQTASTYSIQ